MLSEAGPATVKISQASSMIRETRSGPNVCQAGPGAGI